MGFIERFEATTKSMEALSTGFCPDCFDCTERGLTEEGGGAQGFSWRPCETCGSRLGGDREAAHYLDSDREINHVSVCIDCLHYIANGDIPEEDPRNDR